ncbi:CDP-diacylglycerol--glycerol-3-phosphate 3-phosphatidyltransferase 1 [Nymphaea thermarum]|nr:CDP-diacylglycerol--glycerol-3-phosphate 3-phosphatidyltransferase 1 [Nymphaea thermarum]
MEGIARSLSLVTNRRSGSPRLSSAAPAPVPRNSSLSSCSARFLLVAASSTTRMSGGRRRSASHIPSVTIDAAPLPPATSFAAHRSNCTPARPHFSSNPGLRSAMVAGDKMKDEDETRPTLLTVPTLLTLGRVAAVPLLVAAFYLDSWWASTATTGIFLAAAATDWLDGYLARKMKLGTAFGAFLDPVADKLMVAATLILLCTKRLEVSVLGYVPWLLTVPSIIIIGREITMSAVREWAASQDTGVLEAVAVSNLGKWKTATQMIALTILLAGRDSSHAGSSLLAASGIALLYLSAGLALLSLVMYMKGIWTILLK